MKKTTEHLDSPAQPGFEQWKKKTAWFLSGQAVSLFGSSLTQFAMVWYVTLLTSSGIMIMISSLCSFLPQILISLFAGVWADRFDRKRLIMLADGAIALSTLLFAVIFMTGFQELWLLFLVSAIRSAGAGVQMPAVSALIPQLVPPGKLMRMNGINGTIQSMTMLVAPAVSGVVLASFGLETAFFIDVVTAAIAIGIMLRLKTPKLEAAEGRAQTGALEDMKTGLRYTFQHPFLRAFLIFYAIFMFLITPAALLTPLMTARSFGEEVWRLTANEMVWSFGTVLGGLVIAAWGGFKNRVHTLILGTVLFGLFTMLMGFSGNFVVYLTLLFTAGLTMPLMNSSSMVLLQESVETGMLGRVFGLVQIVSSSAIPLGMVVFGPMADVVKIEWLLIGTGLLMAAAGACMWKIPAIRHGFSNGSGEGGVSPEA